MPRVTLSVAAVCVCTFALFDTSLLAYDRARTAELWRFASASFAHYDVKHLMSNLAAFCLLGGALERAAGAAVLSALLAVTGLLTMACLHLVLDHYVVFAGISALNYALLGALAARALPEGGTGTLLALSVALALQWLAAFGLLPVSVHGTRPAWELHVLALGIGVGSQLEFRRRWAFLVGGGRRRLAT